MGFIETSELVQFIQFVAQKIPLMGYPNYERDLYPYFSEAFVAKGIKCLYQPHLLIAEQNIKTADRLKALPVLYKGKCYRFITPDFVINSSIVFEVKLAQKSLGLQKVDKRKLVEFLLAEGITDLIVAVFDQEDTSLLGVKKIDFREVSRC